MANKRIFSLNIIDTDAFLDMPQTSQLLYFHLAMRADDEGFIGAPKRIMRMLGNSDDDLKILISKKFIIPFSSGVCVIKHWLIHNTIRMDRFNKTTYQKEKSQLTLKDNKSYKLLEDNNGCQTVAKLATQVKLSKVKLSKHTSAVADEPFILKNELQKLKIDGKRHIQLIGEYLEERKVDIQTKAQLRRAIARHAKASVILADFNDEQINKAGKVAEREYPEWTLETLTKILTR